MNLRRSDRFKSSDINSSPIHLFDMDQAQTRIIMCNLHCITDSLPSWGTSVFEQQRGNSPFKNDFIPTIRQSPACVRERACAYAYVCSWMETRARSSDTTVQILAQTLPKMANMSVFKWTTEAVRNRCSRGEKATFFLSESTFCLHLKTGPSFQSRWVIINHDKISACIWRVLPFYKTSFGLEINCRSAIKQEIKTFHCSNIFLGEDKRPCW